MQDGGWLASALLNTERPSGVRVSLLNNPKLQDTTIELVSDGVYFIKAEFSNCRNTLQACRVRKGCVILKDFEVALVLSDTWVKSEMILLVKSCQMQTRSFESSGDTHLMSHKAIVGVASLLRSAWREKHHHKQPWSRDGFNVLILPSLSGLEDDYVPPYLIPPHGHAKTTRSNVHEGKGMGEVMVEGVGVGVARLNVTSATTKQVVEQVSGEG